MKPLIPEAPTYYKDAILNPESTLAHIPPDEYPIFILIPLINPS